MSEFNVYDTIEAATLEDGDLVLVHNDYVEVSRTFEEDDAVMIKGYSHLTGDSVMYFVEPEERVHLWTV